MLVSVWCGVRRYAAVLVWLPVLVLGPLLDLADDPVRAAWQVLLVAVMIGATLVAVVTTDPVRQRPTAYVALGVLAAAVVVGSAQGTSWLPAWVLLVITTPVVVRGRPSVVAVPVITAGELTAAWLLGDRGTPLLVGAGGVALAGVATTSFLRLAETVEELRRTRTELARVAVVEERERFSRDLHDLLGHTLSVMVVKAEAVRRLAARDPDAVAAHAADIEGVGRKALLDVREAVDAMRSPTLADELEGAGRALDAAGIRAELPDDASGLTADADETLAWVVREGTTNVLRHSGAGRCRFELANGGDEIRLSVWDDGVGAAPADDARAGGLDGLRRRVAALGGRLEVESHDGFRLVARVPAYARGRASGRTSGRASGRTSGKVSG